MKLHLILFRHAQAEDAPLGGDDHARPLTDHGKEQAKETAKKLLKQEWKPSLALVSDARRTCGTWDKAARVFDHPIEVVTTPRIYHGNMRELSKLIGEQDAAIHKTVIFVGHNPHISELASVLSGKELRFTKAEAMVLSIKADSWAEAVNDIGEWSVDLDVGPKVR